MAKDREEIINICDTLPACYNIGFSEIEVEPEPIAKGMYGTVHRGRWGDRADAVKMFDLENTDHNFNLAAKEMARMIRLRHQNVLNVYGFYFVEKGSVLKCSMVMELMEFDLNKYIEEKCIDNSWSWSSWSLTWTSIWNRSILKRGQGSPLTDDEVVYITAEIARGMKHVHETGYAHRDLKPQNVLMRRSVVLTGFHLDVKVADFGSSELMSAGQCDQTAGTPCYKAPEQFSSLASNLQPYKMDVYSFGCTCFKLWTGKDPPFKNHAGLMELWEQLKLARNFPGDVKVIITECLDIDPDARPGFSKISSTLDAHVLKKKQVEKLPHGEQMVDHAVRRKEIALELGLNQAVNGLNYAQYVIPPEDLVVEHKLEDSVYVVDWKGTRCALKVLHGYGDKMPGQGIASGQVYEMLPTLIHENIVRFLGYSLTRSEEGEGRRRSILMELLPCNLSEYLQCQRRKHTSASFTEQRRRKIMQGIAEGMKFMHAKGVVHRDLKPTNVLIKVLDEGLVDDYIRVKLIDFGLAATTDHVKAHNMGTTRYLAPEILKNPIGRGSEKIFKRDVYSFAVTCYDILASDESFGLDMSRLKFQQMVMDGKRPELPKETSQDLKNLITSCWSQEPLDRPSFDAICDFFSRPMLL